MAQKYLVESWQGLLQLITKNVVGNGYYHWHVTELPVHKKNEWGRIDNKLISKYQTSINKFKRHRKKAKGLANFRYFRWERFAFIFHTEGTVSSDVVYDDKFHDIRKKPLILKVGEMTSFQIKLSGNGKAHVTLTRDTFLGIKAMLHNVAKKRNPGLLKNTFKQVNGIPSYSGVLRQKKELVDYALKQANKHSITIQNNGKNRKMNRSDFWLYTKTPTVKVFSEDSSLGVK